MTSKLLTALIASTVGCGAIAAEPNATTIGDAGVLIAEVDSLSDVGIDGDPPGPPALGSAPPSSAPLTSSLHRVACAPLPVCDPAVTKGTRAMAPAPFTSSYPTPTERQAWDGREMYVMFRARPDCPTCDPLSVAAYDPVTDVWRALPPPPVDRDALPIVDGSFETVAADGRFFALVTRGVPASDLFLEWREGLGWRTLPALPGAPLYEGTLFWSKATHELLLYVSMVACDDGGDCDVRRPRIVAWDDEAAHFVLRAWAPAKPMEETGRPIMVGDRIVAGETWYDPATDTWTLGPPLPKVRQAHAFTLDACGSAAFMGYSDPVDGGASVAFWSPSTGSWEATPRSRSSLLWEGVFAAGDRVVIWGSHDLPAHGVGHYSDDGAAYVLGAARWEPLPAGRPRPPSAAEPTWTGCDAIFFEPSLPTSGFRYRF